MDANKKQLIADALERIVSSARSGGPQVSLGLMASGSELGPEEVLEGGRRAQRENPRIHIVAVGPKVPGFDDLEWIETPDCETDIVEAMEQALRSGRICGAVAMHYPFPIGVATVGRILTPGRSKPMHIAACTGTTSSVRRKALLRNAIYGIAAAKACGIADPTVGFLNLDGSSVALRAMRKLQENGYAVNFGGSKRQDGGALVRGNDVVSGSVDVLVCDSLTGNSLIKVFSTFTTNGEYESTGWGYGPSVGEGWNDIVSIVSRASGAPVIANALSLTAQAVAENLPALVAAELKAANKAGLAEVLESLQPSEAVVKAEAVKMPPVVPVDADIAGVDVLDMERAVQVLWKEGIYAETAMGCTGPVIRMRLLDKSRCEELLKQAGFI